MKKLKPHIIDWSQIDRFLASADKKLASARKILAFDEEACLQQAYKAMLKVSLRFIRGRPEITVGLQSYDGGQLHICLMNYSEAPALNLQVPDMYAAKTVALTDSFQSYERPGGTRTPDLSFAREQSRHDALLSPPLDDTQGPA